MTTTTESPTRVRAGSEEFSYLERGPREGRLALCLHGFPDAPPSLVPLLEALGRAGYWAVAPWLRGYAPSPLAGPYGPLPLGADVLTLASALAPGRDCAVVGHDWGALAAYAAAGLAPTRVKAIACLSVPHPAALARALPRSPAQIGRSAYALAFQVPRLPERILAADPARACRLVWRWWSPGLGIPAELERAIATCLAASLPAPLGHYRALRRVSQIAALLQAVSPLRVPTLQLHGGRDRCIGAEVGRDDARDFDAPRERREFPDAGHFLHVEAAEKTSRAVLDWLAAHAPAR